MESNLIYDIPPILSVRGLMKVLGLSNYSFSLLDKDESFPFVLIGNQRFVLRDSLLEWMKAHEQSRLRRDANGS